MLWLLWFLFSSWLYNLFSSYIDKALRNTLQKQVKCVFMDSLRICSYLWSRPDSPLGLTELQPMGPTQYGAPPVKVFLNNSNELNILNRLQQLT